MVFTVQTGADSARLLKQWYSFGFKDQIPLLASQNVTDQSVIRHLEAEECEGVMSSSHFAEGLDNQKTRDFVETYPQVSQFWTYDPEEFMKEPPYSRDYQGIKQS